MKKDILITLSQGDTFGGGYDQVTLSDLLTSLGYKGIYELAITEVNDELDDYPILLDLFEIEVK